MENLEFVKTDKTTREKNMVNILDKRCRGFIRYDVLMSVVQRLDLTRQMNIDVVNEVVFKIQAKTKTTIAFNNGEISNVCVQWAQCLLGDVRFGKEVVIVEDGSEIIQESVQPEIISYPAIVKIEEQYLGDIKPLSTRLLIYI